MDWRWLRSFVAVADAGTMYLAQKQSGISQPTLSRHIKQLEDALGVSLFERSGRNLVLSQQGSALFERALDVRRSVKAFERQAVGLSEEEGGSVRVTMSHNFGWYFAPDWLVSLKETHPEITIDLVLEDVPVNLMLREAEIAVRLYRPQQLDLIARQCGYSARGFYASQAYLDVHGRPLHLDELKEHQLIGFDRFMAWIEHAAEMGYHFQRDDFVFRCDSYLHHARVAEAGLGVAVLPDWIGQRSELMRLFPEVKMPGLPVWLAAPPDLHRNPRVSRVWDHLVDALGKVFKTG